MSPGDLVKIRSRAWGGAIWACAGVQFENSRGGVLLRDETLAVFLGASDPRFPKVCPAAIFVDGRKMTIEFDRLELVEMCDGD